MTREFRIMSKNQTTLYKIMRDIYINKDTPTKTHPPAHQHIHTYIHTYIHTHTQTHTQTHTHILTHTPMVSKSA